MNNIVLETEKFLDYVLEVLNEYRLQHGVPQLERDNEVSKTIYIIIYFLYK